MIIETATVVPFLAILVAAALIIQQVYKASLTESIALAVMAVFAGSYLFPFLN